MKQQSKAKTRNRRGRKAKNNNNQQRAKPGRGRFWNESLAPAAVSDNIQQYVTFSGGKGKSSLTMSALVPLAQICSNGHDGTDPISGGFQVLNPQTSNLVNVDYLELSVLGARNETIAVNDDDTIAWISPVFKYEALLFTRYRVKSLEFVYEAQSATDIHDRLVFAYAEDPNHPLITPDETSSPNIQENLLALENSVAFAPWRTWSMDVSDVCRSDLLYTAAQTDSVERLTNFCAIGCIPSTTYTSTQAVTVYGILYIRATIEFTEMCPIAQNLAFSSVQLAKAGYKRDCKDPDCKRCSKTCSENEKECKTSCETKSSSSTLRKLRK